MIDAQNNGDGRKYSDVTGGIKDALLRARDYRLDAKTKREAASLAEDNATEIEDQVAEDLQAFQNELMLDVDNTEFDPVYRSAMMVLIEESGKVDTHEELAGRDRIATVLTEISRHLESKTNPTLAAEVYRPFGPEKSIKVNFFKIPAGRGFTSKVEPFIADRLELRHGLYLPVLEGKMVTFCDSNKESSVGDSFIQQATVQDIDGGIIVTGHTSQTADSRNHLFERIYYQERESNIFEGEIQQGRAYTTGINIPFALDFRGRALLIGDRASDFVLRHIETTYRGNRFRAKIEELIETIGLA